MWPNLVTVNLRCFNNYDWFYFWAKSKSEWAYRFTSGFPINLVNWGIHFCCQLHPVCRTEEQRWGGNTEAEDVGLPLWNVDSDILCSVLMCLLCGSLLYSTLLLYPLLIFSCLVRSMAISLCPYSKHGENFIKEERKREQRWREREMKWREEGERNRREERSFIWWFTPQKATVAWAVPAEAMSPEFHLSLPHCGSTVDIAVYLPSLSAIDVSSTF